MESGTKTVLPQATCKGLTLWPIPEFTDAEVAFGADRSAYLDRHDRPQVPHEFARMASDLFFSGGKLPDFAPQVDRTKAARAIGAWIRSFAPAHEAKEVTVAYALWLWSTEEALAARTGSAA